MWPLNTKASEPLNDLSNTKSLIGVKGHSGTSSICTCVQAEELKELLMDEKLMKNLTWLKILFHLRCAAMLGSSENEGQTPWISYQPEHLLTHQL